MPDGEDFLTQLGELRQPRASAMLVAEIELPIASKTQWT
jgi:hypothetical protein